MKLSKHRPNVRTIRNLADNGGITLRDGYAVTYKTGYQVAGTGTVQLKAILLPYGVKGDVSWASATTSKATVSSSGLVTGVTSGSSVITATCNGFTATCTVTVT